MPTLLPRYSFPAVCGLSLALLAHVARAATPATTPYYSEPSVSPDRQELAFVSGGDVWTVPAAGGEARLLISHAATEGRPLYAPDGKSLAFTSTRTGNGDIYLLVFATGELRRLTFDDAPDQLDAWSPDGRYLYYSSTSRDIAGMNDVYRVPVGGGTPTAVSADRYVNEFFAAPSPDSQTLAFAARGVASSQWWRHGHSHLDESEIWLRQLGSGSYRALTGGGAKALWPMWGTGGRQLFFTSDQGGAENIWSVGLEAGAKPRQVTHFTSGRVLWPSMSADGRLMAFERDFSLWTLDPETGQAKPVAVQRRGAPAGPALLRQRFTDQLKELAVSPDGKKVAFVVRGEVFAASATDGGDATRLTTTTTAEAGLTWAPDSRRLVYSSLRDGVRHLYRYDFGTGQETRLTNTAQPDALPQFSPDGRHLAFVRNSRALRVLEVATGQEHVAATGRFGIPGLLEAGTFTWSPDGRWLAFIVPGARGFANAQVVPTAGGAVRTVSFLANANTGSLAWSPDGKYLLLSSGQRTEDNQVARIDLQPRTPRFREDQFRDLFKETPPTPAPAPAPTPAKPAPAADTARTTTTARTSTKRGQKAAAPAPAAGPSKPPVLINFDDIRRRLSLVRTGLDAQELRISPDGKLLLITASVLGQTNLYVYPLDELSKDPATARQLTSTAAAKADAQFSADGKEVFYLEQGRIQAVAVEAGKGAARRVEVAAELDVDFDQEKLAVFDEAWNGLNEAFNDSTFHGVDWAAERRRFAPYIAGARTPDEVRRLTNLLIGELNASHLGMGPPPSAAAAPSTGRLGVRFEAAEYEQNGRLRLASVLPLSPAAVAGLRPGDVLLAVEGRPLSASTNLDELLQYRIDRRTVLRVASGGKERDVVLRPCNRETEKGLDYRQWVEEQRAYVARISQNRLGYVHMFDMSAASLAQLYLDLDAENMTRDGVVVDVRNNNGGFVNVYAIDVLTRRSYLTFQNRLEPKALPARSALGQRSLELPTVLVTNQHSLSDAEDFSEGYRASGLGKIVGEPTGGWIIFTYNTTLLDGSTLRLPMTTVRAARDGQVMEMAPRPVDVPVTRPIGETYTDHDSQLDAAVRTLLDQLAQTTVK